MDKKDMILALIDHYSGGNKAQFAGMLGVTPQAISTWLKRDTFDMALIFAKCEGVRAEWLLTGTGPMLKTATEAVEERTVAADERPIVLAHEPAGTGKGLPLIPIDAMAGFPYPDAKGATLADCDFYHVPEFERRGAQFMVRVNGESMNPTMNNGDIIGCRRVTDIVYFEWGSVYLLETTQGIVVKRLMPVSGDDHAVLCVSDNNNYPPFQLNKDDIRNISTIVGIIRTL